MGSEELYYIGPRQTPLPPMKVICGATYAKCCLPVSAQILHQLCKLPFAGFSYFVMSEACAGVEELL